MTTLRDAALRAALAQQPEPVSAADLVQRIRELRDEAAKMFIESGSPGYKLHDLYRMKLDAILVAPPQQPEPVQEPVAVPWQGGLTNDELLREWSFRLPGVTPTDRELSAFAIGIETGYKVVWMQRWRLTDEEIDKATGQSNSQFLEGTSAEALPPGISSVRRHRLAG